MKKVLSILLVLVLTLTSVSTGLVGVAETYEPNKSAGRISLSVKSEKEKYAWGDELVFNVSAKNNTESDYKNVKIRAQANKAKFFYDGESNTETIDYIKAGETQDIQIKVKASSPNVFQRMFILPIYYIIDFLSPMAFNANNYDATTMVKVGAFRYKFGFDVTDGTKATDNSNETNKSFTVSFDLNYEGAENSIPEQIVKVGDCATAPSRPLREGYVFTDWYIDKETLTKYDFSVAVSKDIILYAKWIRENDNLVDDVIDLGDIQTLADEGQIEVIYDENGSINTIDGSFTNKRIHSTKDAADLLQSADSLFDTNFGVSEENISMQTVEDNSEVFYKYSPRVDGLKVIGGQIVVSTDSNGAVTGLFSGYDSRINDIDKEPSITEEEAIALAKNELLSDEAITAYVEQKKLSEEELNEIVEVFIETTCELAVCSTMEQPRPVLVYEISFSDQLSASENLDPQDEAEDVDGEELDVLPTFAFNKTVYIYANGEQTGEVYQIVSSVENWTNVTCSSPDLNNINRTYSAQTDGNKYRLIDSDRKIQIYKPTIGVDTSTGIPFVGRFSFPGKIVTSNQLSYKIGVTAHYNLEKIYDFYKNVLGRKSFDGKGSTIKASIRSGLNSIYFSGKEWWMEPNAEWSGEYQQMIFWGSADFEAALDVIAHEFTHGVISYILGNGKTSGLFGIGESGALNESYADIMGEIIEGKNGSDNWNLGEDTARPPKYCMANPSQNGFFDHYSKYSSEKSLHKNSSIFSFAAYKMMTDSRTSRISRETWAKVFYNSLFRLNNTSDFLQARGAIINAAKGLGFTSVQQQAIKDAFDAVGITEPNTIRIVLTWSESPSDIDSHLVGPSISGDRFHVYYSQPNYYEDESYSSEESITIGGSIYKVDLDYDDTDGYGPEIVTIHSLLPGDYYYFVHDYTNRDSLSNSKLAQSGAVVKVYTNARKTPIREYRIPTMGTGTYWNVFKLNISGDEYDSITLWELNTFSNEQKYF